MLFDPKWQRRPVLRGFIAWLERQPADKAYNWSNVHYCACAQFFDQGGEWGPDNAWVKINEGVDLNELARGQGRHDWTFGRLLERAQAALND
jgi:hypothetical protein